MSLTFSGFSNTPHEDTDSAPNSYAFGVNACSCMHCCHVLVIFIRYLQVRHLYKVIRPFQINAIFERDVYFCRRCSSCSIWKHDLETERGKQGRSCMFSMMTSITFYIALRLEGLCSHAQYIWCLEWLWQLYLLVQLGDWATLTSCFCSHLFSLFALIKLEWVELPSHRSCYCKFYTFYDQKEENCTVPFFCRRIHILLEPWVKLLTQYLDTLRHVDMVRPWLGNSECGMVVGTKQAGH